MKTRTDGVRNVCSRLPPNLTAGGQNRIISKRNLATAHPAERSSGGIERLLKRREFITLLGSAAVVSRLPMLVAPAQQQEAPVIGLLSARSTHDSRHLVAAFRRGLSEGSFAEGQNVIIEYRWALGQYDRLPAMATELVRRPVSLLASVGGEPAALSAKDSTSTIPIVFVVGGDPVKEGLAASLNSPGGNSTGVSISTTMLGPKRLGLLRELVPGAATIGVLLDPSFPLYESQLQDVEEAARALALQVIVLRAETDCEIEAAFEIGARMRIAALMVAVSPFFDTRRDKLVAVPARHAVPTMYQFREFVTAGGLVSYGVDVGEAYRQIGLYAARILKGERPADLPIARPTKFEWVINLKTAKDLNLEIPPKVLALADVVIE
jgi:putative tryptophan/tyrosine transport system substrate-binding protein